MEKNLIDSCENCLHDEPAASTAWCPIHVDVVSFMGEMEKGDFKKAYKLLEKRMPFAGIIGMICDHPCESACVRNKLDEAIAVSGLERAAVSYGKTPPKKGLPVPKTGGRVAIVGGGISGLTAAYELDRKGFEVTIIEASDRLGGSFWSFEGAKLTKEAIEEELKTLYNLSISVHLNQRVDGDELNKLITQYDAVFLATGEWERKLEVDSQTFMVRDMPLFAGGGLVYDNNSVIYAVSSGKRAALSIERYVKKISLTASREREGAFITPLNYNLEGLEPSPRVPKTEGLYSEEQAMNEASRCLKCRCAECEKVCPHLRKFAVVPKSYARQIQINDNVIMGTRYANKMINSCAMCGLCTEQCPISIDMEEVIRQTRQGMVEKGKMPVSAHDFALRDMEFSNSSLFYMVKSPPPIPEELREKRERELFTYPRLSFSKYAQSIFKGDAPGTEKMDYLFYPGCQLSASYPEYVEKSYKYLVSEIKEGVGLMLGCCGAPADWAGRKDLMEQSAERFMRVWNETGRPTFILACSSCCAVFERYMPEIPFVSLWEMFDRYGLPEEAISGEGKSLGVHDACSTRHNQAIQESLRNITQKLGYKIDELRYNKEKTKCCGYGGLVYYANREQTADFVKDRINESSDDLLVYCAMCKDLFVEGGKSTYHILDLIFGEDLEALSHRKMPNLSERHENRANLKKKLLKELWNEMPQSEMTHRTDLIVSDEIWRIMDERYILLEELEKVISHAQETGERFFNPADGTYLASLRIGSFTYWVRYAEEEGKIRVVSVYSHRMELVKE